MEDDVSVKALNVFDNSTWIEDLYPKMIKRFDYMYSDFKKVEVPNPDAMSDQPTIKPKFFETLGPVRIKGTLFHDLKNDMEELLTPAI